MQGKRSLNYKAPRLEGVGIYKVRQPVGDKVILMTDVNCAYDLHTAMLVGRKLEKSTSALVRRTY